MKNQDLKAAAESNAWIAEISHDLKTYLNPIVGFASVLMQDRERLQKDQFHQVELIYDSAKKILDRIDALVMLLKLRGGTWQISRGAVRAGQLLAEVAEHLKDFAKKKNVKIVLETAEELCFLSDYNVLSRALRELAGYFLQHLEGGWLKFSCSVQRDKGEAIISFGHSGSSPSDKEYYLWGSFLQEQDSLGDVHGIGLWLALAKEAVVSSGGRLFLRRDGVWEIRFPAA